MYAKDMDEEEAAEWLDGVLVSGANGGPNGRKKTTTAKPAKVASKTSTAKPAAHKPAARKAPAKPAAKTKARTASR